MATEKPCFQLDCEGLVSNDQDAVDFFENITQNADAVQGEVLSAILTLNSGAEYLRQVGLDGHTDRATFKQLAPLVTYEDILPHIQRIANGDQSPILCAQPVSEFFTSSGTSSGERKLIPTNQVDFDRRLHFNGIIRRIIKKQFPGGLKDDKGMTFLFVKPEMKTPGGLSGKTIMTSFLTSRQVQHQAETGGRLSLFPLEVILCQDVVQSMYIQLLYGLIERKEVDRMGSIFATAFLRVVKFLCERWSELVEDIRQRKLVSQVVTDANLRNVVEAMLATSAGAGPAAAAEIETECRKDNWLGILRRLWPRANHLEAIVTGSMAQYLPQLEFYAGGIPIVSPAYGCSECICGFNLTPFCPPSSVCYTMIPNTAFFEFLPLSEEPSSSNLVDLVDVKVDMEYELVVTTFAGLYRYRVGDVLKVQGFYNKTPQFSFVCRKNTVLAVDVDKTDEDTLQKAVKVATSKHLDATSCRLVEFSSYAELSTIPGHYVLFWELSSNADLQGKSTNSHLPTSLIPDFHVFEDCCLTVENCLDTVYRQGRVLDKSIGPLEIRLLQYGSFDALMDYCVAQEASVSQYKTPLCIKSAPLVDLLNSRVTHCFFSPKYPIWTPQNTQ